MIKEARQELAQAIGGVHFLPERINPPLAIVSAAPEYLVQETFCDRVVRFEITLVVAKQESEKALDALDDYIESTLDALPEGFGVDSVEAPGILEWNGAYYLSSKMAVHTTL